MNEGYLDELAKLGAPANWRQIRKLLNSSAPQEYRRGLAAAALVAAGGLALRRAVPAPPAPPKLVALQAVQGQVQGLDKSAARRPYGINPVVNLRPRVRLKQGRPSVLLPLLTAYLTRAI